MKPTNFVNLICFLFDVCGDLHPDPVEEMSRSEAKREKKANTSTLEEAQEYEKRMSALLERKASSIMVEEQHKEAPTKHETKPALVRSKRALGEHRDAERAESAPAPFMAVPAASRRVVQSGPRACVHPSLHTLYMSSLYL